MNHEFLEKIKEYLAQRMYINNEAPFETHGKKKKSEFEINFVKNERMGLNLMN